MSTGPLRRRLSVWAAVAIIVAETMGVGIFLIPAQMSRTLASAEWVVGVWVLMGLLSAAGALCYAELGTRFPEAGGGYVYLREAFGDRCAFVYGWMLLLVMDPGLTAALGVGLATYLVVLLGVPAALIPAVAVAVIIMLAGISVLGAESSARVIRWTVIVKLVTIAMLLVAVSLRGSARTADAISLVGPPSVSILAGALMGAFFAFGGWWDLGKMGEEVVEPRRTLPIALLSGVGIVTLVYAGLSVAFLRVVQGTPPATDDAFVSTLGSALFGAGAGKFLAAAVVIVVAGTLTAILLGAPRVYLAMARAGVFPPGLVRFDSRRQAAPRATLIQVGLACVLVVLGTFDQILGYLIPAAVFFTGLAAAAILKLPRPPNDGRVFRAPGHPVPILIFLLLIVVMVALFAVGRPLQTLISAAVIAVGIPMSWVIIKHPRPVSRPGIAP